ncbi:MULTISPECIES: YwaF family protein [Neobacillus]|uniref:TIGR02206 family membrane protein n=1 Tax=Neobacillus rhizophilus TaxID=2833579 RepID=A0A942UA08_9BACI|nr:MULTISPECIES: TIGR02206 family membrane protein [Neobacillus]MBS4213564.1 TIGR02206 family membrane protein [Neobacillus rhizophilus]MBU8918028.1 TIGR02206 family membrane protein [Bacillus sp. FJAT-29953]
MEWFGDQYAKFDFEMFSSSHFIIMGIFLGFTAGLYYMRGRLKDEKWRHAEIGLAISLIILELINHLWMYANGNWKASHSLPLELCNISLLLTIIFLFSRKKLLYEILLFTGLLGATQAIFTPSLNYDFPHFRFFHFFITHMVIVWVPLYFTWAKGYRPTFWSCVKLFVFMNVLAPTVFLINHLVDGNYMYLNHKPKHASLLDVLGPYPYYILSLEVLTIILTLSVWLVFRDKKGKIR